MDASVQAALIETARQLGWTAWRIESTFPGNADRSPDQVRHHLLVSVNDHSRFKVTVGRKIAAIAESQRSIRHHFPDLIPTPVQTLTHGDLDVLIEAAIDGQSLESLWRDPRQFPQSLVAWDSLQVAFANNLRPSTSMAWQAEWELWSSRFQGITLWSETQREELMRRVLPSLRDRLLPSPDQVRSRWTNGDLTTSNIIITSEGRPHLLDFEFAAETHFYFEDLIRLRFHSPTLLRHPGLAEQFGPFPVAAALQFFRLKQLWLESITNSAAYLHRVGPASIRSILEEWPQPRWTGFDSSQHESAQLFTSPTGVWSEEQSQLRPYPRGSRQWFVWSLSSGSPTARLDPVASLASTRLHRLEAVSSTGSSCSLLHRLTAIGCELTPASDCTVDLKPLNPDPQLLFDLPNDSRWLILELETDPLTETPA